MRNIIKYSLTQSILNVFVPAHDCIIRIVKTPKIIHEAHFKREIFYRYIPLTFFFTWLFSLLPTQLDSIFYIFILIMGSYSVFDQSSKSTAYKNTLLYYIVLFFGFLGIRSFVGHTFMADYVAETIAWEKGSPFQIELAFYHLGLSIASIIYIWNQTKELALGLIISKSVFLFGAMGVHIYHLLVNSNTSSGNIGPGIIFGDLILPTIIIYLYIKAYNQN